jgi:hypothetical protein
LVAVKSAPVQHRRSSTLRKSAGIASQTRSRKYSNQIEILPTFMVASANDVSPFKTCIPGQKPWKN